MDTISIVILCMLAGFMVMFLVGISAQTIRIEKSVTDAARHLEHKVKKILHGEL